MSKICAQLIINIQLLISFWVKKLSNNVKGVWILEREIELFLDALFEQSTKNLEKIKEKESFLCRKKNWISDQTNFFLQERIKEEKQTYSRKKS